MALIKCIECGKEISDKASSCPNCGIPIASQVSSGEGFTFNSGPQSTTKKPNKNFAKTVKTIIGVIVILVVALIAFAVIRTFFSDGVINKAAEVMLNSSPVTIIDGIENVQAHSWQAVPFTLPYAGMLTIDASIENGNNIHIEVINQESLQAFENKGSYGVYPNFSAPQTYSYKRSSRMAAGNYYLLLQDKTWGILSSKASDVKVLARLTL